jgi:hypothetical protein
MTPVVRQTSVVLAPLLKQLHGLMNARWVSVHEVVVRLIMYKLVPLGRLRQILKRDRTVYLVQPVPYMWNVVIFEVRHEEKIAASSSG